MLENLLTGHTQLHTPTLPLFKFLFSSLTELAGLQDITLFEVLVFLAGWLYTTRSGRKQLVSGQYVSFTLHHHLFAFLGLTEPTGERPLVVAIGSTGRLQYPTLWFGALKTRHYHVSSSHAHT